MPNIRFHKRFYSYIQYLNAGSLILFICRKRSKDTAKDDEAESGSESSDDNTQKRKPKSKPENAADRLHRLHPEVKNGEYNSTCSICSCYFASPFHTQNVS